MLGLVPYYYWFQILLRITFWLSTIHFSVSWDTPPGVTKYKTNLSKNYNIFSAASKDDEDSPAKKAVSAHFLFMTFSAAVFMTPSFEVGKFEKFGSF